MRENVEDIANVNKDSSRITCDVVNDVLENVVHVEDHGGDACPLDQDVGHARDRERL